MVPARKFRASTAGVSAVEFALVMPLLLLILFGIVSFGTLFGAYQGVQQLVAEAARASVAGLSNSERDQLARDFILRNVDAYTFLDPSKLVVTTASSGPSTYTFSVTAAYDLSSSPIYRLSQFVPLPPSTLRRSAIVQYGGYM